MECRLIAAVGDPTAEILAAVEESGARWLVVGRGDRRHRLRRSVSVKLARAAKCDLVFVH